MGKKAVSASLSMRGMHDPGFIFAYANLKQDQSIDEAQQILLKTVEGDQQDGKRHPDRCFDLRAPLDPAERRLAGQ